MSKYYTRTHNNQVRTTHNDINVLFHRITFVIVIIEYFIKLAANIVFYFLQKLFWADNRLKKQNYYSRSVLRQGSSMGDGEKILFENIL